MSQHSVERFLGQLITDDDFRNKVKKAFSKICFEEGFDFTDTEQKIIRQMDVDQFATLSNILDKRIKRSRRHLGNYLKGGGRS